MFADYELNKNDVETYFKTPNGHVISWTKLLLIKDQILDSTNKDVDIKVALKLVECIL